MVKILIIGDCSIDAFLEIHEASTHARVNREEGELSFKYGDKIPIEKLSFLSGGNAANCSVGFSRLGPKTGIIASLGTDEFAEKIVKNFKKERVDTTLLQKEAGSSNFSVIINFSGERTLFTYHVKRTNQLPQIPKTDWIYLTSLGDYWQKAYEEVVQFVKNNKVKLAFSPGSHQLEGEPAILKEILSLTTILFVNKEEAEKISNKNEGIIQEVLRELQKKGPETVSITDGTQGSWAINPNGEIFSLGISPANIVERTGAGDAYSSGFLSAISSGLKIEEAMRWGAVNAASVIEKIGAQAGLLTQEEIEKKLKGWLI